jgi:teichuronic acid biosynthesis glycosyltransferase TuaC
MRTLGGTAETLRRRPVRLLTLTTLFPNAQRPRHGVFVANRLRHLCATGRVEASVIAAVPWFPGAYRDDAGVPAVENLAGLPVRHPRYLQVPGVGMRLQPDALARALLRTLRDDTRDGVRYDVVDAHYFYPDGVAAARVARVLGLPLVISARCSDINLIGDIAFARERMVTAASQAQALIAVSGALAARMGELGMPAARTYVLRNGVDTDVFAPVPRVEARRRLGLAPEGRLLLGVGNLVEAKGFDLLVRAVALLPDMRLLLVGDGPCRGELGVLAEAQAPGRVDFRGNMPQAELRFAYPAADVLGLASLREGWPNVVLEAMACGTPVIASPVGGVPEILGDDAPGRLVAERTPAAWAAAVSSMLGSPPPPDTVRAYAMDFGWDDVVDRQCALYETVAARHAEARA